MAAISFSIYKDLPGFCIVLVSAKTPLDFARRVPFGTAPHTSDSRRRGDFVGSFYFILMVCVHDVCVGGLHMTHSVCGGWRTTLGSRFSFFPHHGRSPRDWTGNLRLNGKYLYILSCFGAHEFAYSEVSPLKTLCQYNYIMRSILLIVPYGSC